MDPNAPESSDAALSLADIGDHVVHGDTVFEVRTVHLRKRVERDRLGNRRTLIDYQIVGYDQPGDWAGDESIIGDLL